MLKHNETQLNIRISFNIGEKFGIFEIRCDDFDGVLGINIFVVQKDVA